MGEVKRTTEEIEREIAHARARLAGDVEALQIVVKERLDWKHHVRQHPVPFLAAAFLVGVLLGR
jgi:hypothetical protein